MRARRNWRVPIKAVRNCTRADGAAAVQGGEGRGQLLRRRGPMEQFHRRRLYEAGVGRALVAIVLRLGHDLEERRRDAPSLHCCDQRTRLGSRRLAVQELLRETLDETGLNPRRLQDALERALSGHGVLLDTRVESGDERRVERLRGDEGRHFAQDNGRRGPRRRSSGLRGCGGEAACHHRPLFKSQDLRSETLPPAPRQRPRSLRVRGHELLARGELGVVSIALNRWHRNQLIHCDNHFPLDRAKRDWRCACAWLSRRWKVPVSVPALLPMSITKTSPAASTATPRGFLK